MVYHWASKNVKQSGYDDMVLLPKINEDTIFENLKKRLMDNYIYTYIGPVLIAVNPYKDLPYFTDVEVEQYRGATQIENPPHIYAVADFMYRNMLIDNESQCVIISGESGAGKTVSAKYIMSYVSKVSGGYASSRVQHIKEIILQSNPLLEAFGNAKTLRNNNSSRFGKYVEIQFSRSGEPIAGRITNFLLEKSRVVSQIKNERSFHVFYQLCATNNDDLKKKLGIIEKSRFSYLNKSGCYTVDGVNDTHEFDDVVNAMNVISMSSEDQFNIFKLLAGILHLGNVHFKSDGNYAQPENLNTLEYPAYLLGIDKDTLRQKLISRTIETKAGSRAEKIDVTLNVEQADYTRDALAKGIYSRLFDYLVGVINSAMESETPGGNKQPLSIGILDIYGFEIFDSNGFEQFCINFVNEKLQQIFIELTLKAEQEEYKQEGIKWTEIDYFNNKIVCDLIESKSPPGVFSICDDVVITMHATGDGADRSLLDKLGKSFATHAHFSSNSIGFQIKHYAGNVEYKIEGFCEKNRDVLFQDLIDLMKTSKESFIRNLFNDQPLGAGKRPTTAGSKIKSQANQLVEKLMKCYPSYVRCIKPNENKAAREADEQSMKHQVKYLGLVENVRVRRAGFAYRREFAKFIQRYGIVAKETKFWTGPVDKGIKIIMNSVNMDPDQWQMGKTKVFIKAPESLFLLEEVRDRRYNEYALVLQKAFRRFNAAQYYLKLKTEAADLMLDRKERRSNSLNRKFYGDYIGLDKPSFLAVRALLPKKETVEFAQTCSKFDRQFNRQKRDFVLTNKAMYIIGREELNKKDKLISKLTSSSSSKKTTGSERKIVEVIKRKIEYGQVDRIALSRLADNFLVLFPSNNEFGTLLEIEFKTEFLTTFSKKFKEATGRTLNIAFTDSIEYEIKKDGFFGGGSRTINFVRDASLREVQIKSSGKTCTIRVPGGLPNNSRPTLTYYKSYNFESEPWWPKFESLRAKYGITVVKGGDEKRQPRRQQQQQPATTKQQQYPTGGGGANLGANMPAAVSSSSENLVDSSSASGFKPPIKQRKPKLAEPNHPKSRALYPYSATEPDELTFTEGDIIYIVKEENEVGWWTGICRGKTGLFPSNYVEKI